VLGWLAVEEAVSVYIDRKQRWGRQGWCHLIADSLEELHAFAASIGLPRRWFQGAPPASFPHYDLNGSRIGMASDAGAVFCDRVAFVGHIRRLRPHYGIGPRAEEQKP
jgi:hypothetical protein